MSTKFTSKALEANLAETRYRDIYIPEKHKEFIALSKSYFGVNKRAHDCITEYHHPLSNRKFVVEELREILITDFWLYTREDMHADAYAVPLEMMRKLLTSELHGDLQKLVIQTLLEFIQLTYKKSPAHCSLVPECLEILEAGFAFSPLPFIISNKFILRYLGEAAEDKDNEKQALAFARKVFLESYQYWKTTSMKKRKN